MNKTIAIIVALILFIGVIFQALVIVDYHSDEFNPGFFRKRENPVVYFESFDEAIANQFFKPFDIYLRDGSLTWIVRKDEDLFNTLWEDGKSVLIDALSDELKNSTLSWAELSEKPGILFKMGCDFPTEFISFLSNEDIESPSVKSMDRLLVIPSDGIMEIYIKSGRDVLFTSALTPKGLFTTTNFNGLLDLFAVDPYYSQNSYTEIHKFVSADVLDEFIEPDIPVTLDINSRNLPWLKLSLPTPVRDYIDSANSSDEEAKAAGIEEAAAIIKSKIISRTLNTYEMHIDSFDNLFFSNQFNIYEVSKAGWISYNYTEGAEGDGRGDIGTAFMNAVETLGNVMRLSDNSANLYLSDVKVYDDSYEFFFDYRFKGSVLVMDQSSHAMEIKATATRTIEANIYPLNIEEMTGDQYIDSRYKTAFLFITNFNGITNINTIEASNMYLGYVKTDARLEVVKPVWVIELQNGEKQVLDLVEAGE